MKRTASASPAAASLILFDIDGTLLRGGGVGRRAMEAALAEELGGSPSLAHVPFHGNTDPAIVAAGLIALGVEPTPDRVADVLRRYLAITRAWLAEHNPFVALAGAVELVRHLQHGVGGRASLGLGTGNIEAAAWLKVEAIGVGDAFRFGGFGSDHEERGELLRVGWHRGAALHDVHPERCRVLVIGDTLKDIAAARHIDAEVLAVATGGDPHDVLAEQRPDHLAHSLSEDEVFVFLDAWLGRGDSGA